MTLLFIDSFDHYATAQLANKYTTATATGLDISATGRNGTSGLVVGNGNPAPVLDKYIGNQSDIIFGAAIKLSSISASQTCPIVEFVDSTSKQVGVYITPTTGTLVIKRNGSGGTALYTTASALTTGIWYYFEFGAKIHHTAGTAKILINGVSWADLTGQDTNQSANAYANIVRMDMPTSVLFAGTITYDDLYILNTSGTRNNTYLGDIRIEALTPTSDGTNLQWATSSGSTHYTLVDENPPNSDTDYVLTSGVGYYDTYGFSNLTTTSGTILGVQYNLFARKDDAGSRSLLPAAVIDGVTYSGTTILSVGDTYSYLTSILETSLKTAANWTIAEINGSEFGQKLEA